MVTLGIGIVDTNTVLLASVLFSSGLILVFLGGFGIIPPLESGTIKAPQHWSEVAIRTVMAVCGVAGLYVLTGWPVAAFYGGVGGWFFLTIKNAKKERHAQIDRVDAIATWVENLRDNISSSAGLQQALRMSADQAPEVIRDQVRDLVLRLQHEPVTTALRRFAADVAHPTADMAVGCLILASSRAAGSLAHVLAKTAQAARDSASMMRQVDAGRSGLQSQAKLVAIVSSLGATFLIVTKREFVEPYSSFGGQIALFLICSLFAGSAVAVYRLSKPSEPERVFRGVENQIADVFADAAQ